MSLDTVVRRLMELEKRFREFASELTEKKVRRRYVAYVVQPGDEVSLHRLSAELEELEKEVREIESALFSEWSRTLQPGLEAARSLVELLTEYVRSFRSAASWLDFHARSVAEKGEPKMFQLNYFSEPTASELERLEQVLLRALPREKVERYISAIRSVAPRRGDHPHVLASKARKFLEIFREALRDLGLA